MSKLSPTERRIRAVKFCKEWKDAAYEKGETQSFYNDFFEIFGIKRHRVSRFEERVTKLDNSHGFIDLFWPGVLIVEQKSAGKNLDKAAEQAGEYFDALPDAEKPDYQLVCDFQNFRLLNRDTRKHRNFTLAELPENLDAFEFMLGNSSDSEDEQQEMSIDASELMGRIHIAVMESGYDGKDLEILLTRLTFCMFADYTEIFEYRLFKKIIEGTGTDNTDMDGRIAKIFQTLDDDPDNGDRLTTLDEKMNKLPYINGKLFKDTIKIPSFDFRTRQRLSEAAKFDWSDISPAIFGSMFQSVMDAEKRREQGAHYTNERDILKIVDSLFMDDLWHEFKKAKRNTSNLKAFHNKLASMTFLDPACGCGNFLVIAYRELRRLEIEILLLLNTNNKGEVQQNLDVSDLSKIDVHQFYGIELDDFAAHIARSALWMMDHLMNRKLGEKLGQPTLRIPLEKSPTIICADALDEDWGKFLPPEKCSFILGNPPFSGQSPQSPKKREQMRILTKPDGKNATPLDYVGAWFLKSAAYVRQADHNIPFAFVATNSITQGEQVTLLWQPLLHEYKLDIIFAHQTFEWESEARGKAHVHVVIIGLEKQEHARKDRMLFSYEEPRGEPVGESVAVISPYLFDASKMNNPNLIIKELSKPITPRPIMKFGVKPNDGGHYIFRGDEIANFLKKEPKAKKFMRPFIGGYELINDKKRSILYLEHATPNELEKMPLVQKRIDQVRNKRQVSKKPATKKLALYPTLFETRAIPTKPFIAIPEVSSERREYIPIDLLAPPVITSNKAHFIESSDLAVFALLISTMHMAWMRKVTGRLKSDYSYSIGVVYNTFPLPLDKDLSKLAPYGQAILDARAKHPNTKLANLYRPNMLPNMRKAHEANDRAVDRLYSAQPFADDTARINHLFALYEKQTAQ